MREDAIYFYDKTLQKRTYGQLNEDINSFIAYLNDKGVKTGDRVFIFTPVSYKLTVFMIAAFKLGIQVMFLDINAKQETFDKLFSRFRPDYILVSNKTRILKYFFNRIRRGFEIINIDKISSNYTILKELPKIPDDAPALLTTTTGSTGVPKIIVRSHLDLFNQLELVDNNLPKSNKQIIMSTSFIYIFAILARGDIAVLPQINLNASAEKINQRLQIFKCVPISIIITSPIFGLKATNIYSDLKRLYIGGASINLQEAEIIQKKFSNSQNYMVYGATECNILTYVLLTKYIHELRENYRSTLGKPFDGVSIKIAEDESILVSCNALIKGFVNDKSEYAVCNGDWYNTNDKGYIKNGILYYRGKYDYYVIFDNEKIYSHEIGQFLSVEYTTYKKCAVVQKKGVIYLFGTEREYADELSEALLKKYGFNVKYRYVKSLPHDIRHHTKTDYKKLLSLI